MKSSPGVFTPTIVTPYIRSGTAAAVSCYVVNTGSTPAVVTIELVGVSGNVVSFAPDLETVIVPFDRLPDVEKVSAQ